MLFRSHHKDACRMMRYLMMPGAAVDFQSVFPLRPGLGGGEHIVHITVANRKMFTPAKRSNP